MSHHCAAGYGCTCDAVDESADWTALVEHARHHWKRADDAGRLARHVLEVLDAGNQHTTEEKP